MKTTTSQSADTTVHKAADGPGPLLWQRTDTIGTELVFQGGGRPTAASGTAVVGGPRPYTTRWRAELNADWTLRSLTVTCEGAGWQRELTLTRDDGNAWTSRTQSWGELDGPEPGPADDAQLTGIVRLNNSPMFLTWAMRALRLLPEGAAVTAPTTRILTPSLAVVVGESRYQRLGDQRLRVSGEEPAASYDLDAAGVVTYQPGRLRINR